MSGVDVTNNVIYDIEDAGIYFHCGSDNRANGNVFAACGIGGSKDAVLGGCNAGGNPTWPNLPHGFNFTQNIVYIEDAARLIGTYAPDFRDVTFDDNVYFSPNASTLAQLVFPNFTSWAAWRADGNDPHSIEKDPLFLDAAGRDFRLQPSSPALALGIPQPNQAAAGSHGTPLPSV